MLAMRKSRRIDPARLKIGQHGSQLTCRHDPPPAADGCRGR
jgi:hypothetical protein